MRAVALALGACVLATGSAAAAEVPDPLAPGPYGYKKIEYNAGNLMITIPPTNGGASQTFPQPLEGSIIYPDTPGPWKVILFQHGRHSTCISPPTSEGLPPITDPDVTCRDTDNPDGTENRTNIRNYAGYDYLATNLASHGYVVMSISANTIHGFDNTFSYDAGGNARSQTIAASLDLLYRWNNGAGPIVPGDDANTVGTKLTGKLEMQRIGLMGHSRGGEGVTDFIRFNRRRPSPGRVYNLEAVFSLAPIDSQRQVPIGTNYATLLPACDGDVSTLAGANAYERSKYAELGDPNAKVQFYVQGANHNYYNTVWTNDDGNSYSGTGSSRDVACGERVPGNIRLFPVDQRKNGMALMNSFLRTYLGKESAFKPLMTGEAPYPSSACPTLRGVPCDDLVKTSYIAPAGERQDIIRPEASNPLTLNATGGELKGEGFATFDACNNDRQGGSTAIIKSCAITGDTLSSGVNRSFGRQLMVAWQGKAKISAGLVGAGRDASKWDALSLRAAVNYGDARNPVTDGTNPDSAEQDFEVVLIDRAGKEAKVNAADFGSALQPSIGSFRRHVVLNGIRIPLSEFEGVDLTDLASIELRFGEATPTGSIQIADVAFQEPATAKVAPTGIDAPVIAPAGRKATDAIAVGGITATPSDTVCTDTAKPNAKLASLKLSGGKLLVSGIATDAGCEASSGKKAKPGKLARVQISVAKVSGKTCRYLTQRGTLSKPTTCLSPVSLVAKGKSDWSLKAKAKLPKGTYKVTIQAVDAAGNLESSVTKKTLRIS